MVLKFLKIFFSIIAIILFAFLLDITFYFSNFSDNSKLINSISIKKDLNTYLLKNNKLEKIKNNESNSGILVKNINITDKIFFSNSGSFSVNFSSGTYNINLKKGLFFLDLNDLSSKYKITSLGFDIIPKSTGMLFIDNTDASNVLIFSLNSIYKFVFKSFSGNNVNYYYMYPHNYLIFNINNNKFSRLGGDVFRIKTIVQDGFFNKKIENNLNLGGILKGNKLYFLKNIFTFIKSNSIKYNFDFEKLKKLDSFHLIGEKFINKYFNYFINESKKKIYYKQSVLNDIEDLYKQKKTGSNLTIKIIKKLEKLKQFDKKSYNQVLDIINGYYKIIVKNNSLKDRVILDNFLPLVEYIKLIESGKITSVNNLVLDINKNQVYIFKKSDFKNKELLISENLNYLYLLRNIDIQKFNRIVLSLKLKYKNLKKDNLSEKYLFLLDKYYYGVLNLKQGNDDLELYVLLKNIFFAYDFGNNLNIEKYFNEFVNNYFSKLKIINGKIILGQHLDLVLLESFLYYLEDYLNKFAFNNNINNYLLDTNKLKLNINILDKYMFLNNLIYFNDGSEDLIKTGLFKNRDLLNKLLIFIRKNLFDRDRDANNLLIISKNNDLNLVDINKLKIIINKFFILKNKFQSFLENSSKQRVLLDNYDNLYKKYKEYFLALTSYENYKAKYNKSNEELNNYSIKITDKVLGIDDIKKYLSQFNDSSFVNTEIKTTKEKGEFFVNNFRASGREFSFLIDPERNYTISNIIILDDPVKKNTFKNFTFSLEKDKEAWDRAKKYAKGDEREYFDFKNYFKYKFYPHKEITNINTDIVTNNNENEDESVMVFKRDKLLAKTGEFSSIYDILKLNYNNVIVKNLDNITIKKASVFYKTKNYNYLGEFSSKYLINIKANKHYFYNNGGIYISFYDLGNGGNIKRPLLGGNKIKIDFNISVKNFREIFNNIFNEIHNIDKIYYNINSIFGIYDISIIYKQDGKIVIGFEFNKKIIKIYLSGNKVLFIINNGKIISDKNITLDQNLEKVLLKLK